MSSEIIFILPQIFKTLQRPFVTFFIPLLPTEVSRLLKIGKCAFNISQVSADVASVEVESRAIARFKLLTSPGNWRFEIKGPGALAARFHPPGADSAGGRGVGSGAPARIR